MSVSPSPRAPEPLSSIRLLAVLGQAMSAAGDSVSSTKTALERVAAAYAVEDVEIGVLPTLVMVRARANGEPYVELASLDAAGPDKSLRLDQIALLDHLVADAINLRITAPEALARVEAMWQAPPRFGALVRLIGYVVLSVGLGLILTPQPVALAWCLGLGLLVGIMKEIGERWATTDVLLPVASALVVSVLVFGATKAGLVTSPLLLLIPPLILFLPGGMLTTAMVELADGHPISGATRLVAGSTQVVLLVFGIVAGEVLVQLPPGEAYVQHTASLLGWWAPLLGPLVFTVGMHLNCVGPPRALPWLILVVYVAWVGELLGTRVSGAYLGGFVGATAMSLVSYTADRIFVSAPPAGVLFLPAFWFLVPGVLAVVGFAELLGADYSIAITSIETTAFTVISVAFGILVGAALARIPPLLLSRR